MNLDMSSQHMTQLANDAARIGAGKNSQTCEPHVLLACIVCDTVKLICRVTHYLPAVTVLLSGLK